jgi:uncharacterized membrane protein YfcA
MAVLYSSVGQGGGSGYLAAMALVGIAPDEFRTIALLLNVVVASVGLFKFSRAGHLDPKLLASFIVSSVPLAFLGGLLSLPEEVFRPLVGLVLLWAAALLLWRPPPPGSDEVARPPIWAALISGGLIGILSGLIGVGGGIFLAPLLILMKWCSARTTAATTSGFILVNSVAALMGVLSHRPTIPAGMVLWVVAVAVGGWMGAEFGSKRLSPKALQRILALVLIIAGARSFMGP